MSKKTIHFSATDTLFFRESRPMEAMGELQSIFPPSMQTLTGAVRTWIGDIEKTDWADFKAQKAHPLRQVIGDPDQANDLGTLRFNGAWLSKEQQRLYPAPLHIMKKDNKLFQLCLSEEGYYCDLGTRVRLPQLLNDDAKGGQSLENHWIDSETLATLLHGKTVNYDKKHFFPLEKLVNKESRIGIARDNRTHVVKDGMLYQTQHLRLRDHVGIEVDVMGLAEHYTEGGMIRLGGEGRSANLSIMSTQTALPSISISEKTESMGIMLYLLTPLLIQKKSKKWQPLPDFVKHEPDENAKATATTYWQGNIHGITLKLHGAITGKALRYGGWDLVKHQPRTMQSFIPAGSVFYCTPADESISIKQLIDTLHDTQLGEQQHYGYGHIAAGLWK